MIYVAFTKPEIDTPLEKETLKLYCCPEMICELGLDSEVNVIELLRSGGIGFHAAPLQEDPLITTDMMPVSALVGLYTWNENVELFE